MKKRNISLIIALIISIVTISSNFLGATDVTRFSTPNPSKDEYDSNLSAVNPDLEYNSNETQSPPEGMREPDEGEVGPIVDLGSLNQHTEDPYIDLGSINSFTEDTMDYLWNINSYTVDPHEWIGYTSSNITYTNPSDELSIMGAVASQSAGVEYTITATIPEDSMCMIITGNWTGSGHSVDVTHLVGASEESLGSSTSSPFTISFGTNGFDETDTTIFPGEEIKVTFTFSSATDYAPFRIFSMRNYTFTDPDEISVYYNLNTPADMGTFPLQQRLIFTIPNDAISVTIEATIPSTMHFEGFFDDFISLFEHYGPVATTEVITTSLGDPTSNIDPGDTVILELGQGIQGDVAHFFIQSTRNYTYSNASDQLAVRYSASSIADSSISSAPFERFLFTIPQDAAFFCVAGTMSGTGFTKVYRLSDDVEFCSEFGDFSFASPTNHGNPTSSIIPGDTVVIDTSFAHEGDTANFEVFATRNYTLPQTDPVMDLGYRFSLTGPGSQNALNSFSTIEQIIFTVPEDAYAFKIDGELPTSVAFFLYTEDRTLIYDTQSTDFEYWHPTTKSDFLSVVDPGETLFLECHFTEKGAMANLTLYEYLPPEFFISTWDTSLVSLGSSSSNQVTLPLTFAGSYDFSVNWGDGSPNQTITAWSQSEKTHTYSTSGEYQILISGEINGWRFNNGGDKLKLIEISQWGCLQLGGDSSYFYGCENLNHTATDELNLTGILFLNNAFKTCYSLGDSGDMNGWDVSQVVSMENMFQGATTFDQSLSEWDTGSVVAFSNMFEDAATFNQNITDWDTSSATYMYYMFRGATSFNQPIGDWETHNVGSMVGMFMGASVFNQPIGTWDVSSVVSMINMFNGASSFNQSLNSWITTSLTSLTGTFYNASSFNQPLDNWDVSGVTIMSATFRYMDVFNQNINNWDTSSVTNMQYVFANSPLFNQPLNGWDTSSVTRMNNMFQNTESFNQPLENWDTSNVNYMEMMFYQALSFDQALGSWTVSSVSSIGDMLLGASLSTENYDDLLIGWAGQTLTPGLSFHAGDSYYSSDAASARQHIIDTYSWIIEDNGPFPIPGDFTLSCDADSPDTDGTFDLSWTSSTNANNYTLYQYSGYITEINGSLTLLVDQTTDLFLPIMGYTDGTYYFIIVASNNYGELLSLCIEVIVDIPKTLTITDPITSSIWNKETSQYVYWTSTGDISDVQLELYANDAFVVEIISSTPNDGEFYWFVPASLSDSTLYQIKAVYTSDESIFVYSDYFEIVVPSLTIMSPTSTSAWETETSQDISWTSEGTISTVQLELYDGDTFVMEISASTENDGQFSWTIPTNLDDSTNYRIKITDSVDSSTYAYSGYFEIKGKKVPGFNILILVGILGLISMVLVKKQRSK